MQIFYHPGKENVNVDALSRSPLDTSPDMSLPDKAQVVEVQITDKPTELDIHSLLTIGCSSVNGNSAVPGNEFGLTQEQDPELQILIQF